MSDDINIMGMARKAVAFEETQLALQKWLYHTKRLQIVAVSNEAETYKWAVLDMSIANRGEFLHKALIYASALEWALEQPEKDSLMSNDSLINVIPEVCANCVNKKKIEPAFIVTHYHCDVVGDYKSRLFIWAEDQHYKTCPKFSFNLGGNK